MGRGQVRGDERGDEIIGASTHSEFLLNKEVFPMSVINTNISATIATNALIRNERSMSTAMERLSTGMRINSAKDDAAGLAIYSRMKAAVSGLEMAAKNANDAI